VQPHPVEFPGRYIVVADEDKAVVNMVIRTLLSDGHAVFQAYNGLSALQLALNLKICDLVISNTRVGGAPGVDLIRELRTRLPHIGILYIASPERSTPELEAQLPDGVPILREPFTAEELRSSIRFLLPR
jgi:DNA-binding response OmpR family regulator